jgi:hypothetical protein
MSSVYAYSIALFQESQSKLGIPTPRPSRIHLLTQIDRSQPAVSSNAAAPRGLFSGNRHFVPVSDLYSDLTECCLPAGCLLLLLLLPMMDP